MISAHARELLLWVMIIISFSVLFAWRRHVKGERVSHQVRVGASARLFPPISEASGLCLNPQANLRTSEHYYWTHNDSFDSPRAFLITLEGKLIHEVNIPGVANVDWEACTSAANDPTDGTNVVFIADSGNNFHWRDHLFVYALRSRKEEQGIPLLTTIKTYKYTFPRESLRPPLDYWNDDARCLDIESIFWRQGELFMISKCMISRSPMLWRLPREAQSDPPSAGPLRLQHILDLPLTPSEHPLYERVTGASYSDRTGLLVVLTYQSLWFYKVSGPAKRPEFVPVGQCNLNVDRRLVSQAEAVIWVARQGSAKTDESGQVAVLTEGGDVYRYKITEHPHRLECAP